ncbi:MAG: hypothetical protein Q4E99_05385, partial [Bacillota bacterium]|nr:hypothetical protein [Bacillota bacterium]
VLTDLEGKPRYFANGLRVKFDDRVKAYDSASAGEVWGFVANLEKYKINAPEGKEPTLLYDPYTLAKQFKKMMVGSWFAGGQVCCEKAFAKFVKGETTNIKPKANAKAEH